MNLKPLRPASQGTRIKNQRQESVTYGTACVGSKELMNNYLGSPGTGAEAKESRNWAGVKWPMSQTCRKTILEQE